MIKEIIFLVIGTILKFCAIWGICDLHYDYRKSKEARGLKHDD